MSKSYKVVNRFRFTLFVILSIIIITTIANFALGLNTASSLSSEDEYITIPVGSGDTLWEIAETYKPSDMDTRKAVYMISRINNVSADHLEAGTIIKIPIYH